MLTKINFLPRSLIPAQTVLITLWAMAMIGPTLVEGWDLHGLRAHPQEELK